ncbi:MAG: phage holin family protein [Bacteroidales bacterium]|nr:phage holin family protein [Bacteroidales bacterium]
MKITINSSNSFYNGHAGCITRLMLLSIAVMVGAWLLPGVDVTSFWAVLLTAIVISLLDNLVRPILIVVTLPVTAITLGLFLFVINAVIILMASAIVEGFKVDNFGSALLFSLILTAVNYLLELPNKYLNRKELQEKQDDDTDDYGFTPYEEIKD